jgi:hypothetical protein
MMQSFSQRQSSSERSGTEIGLTGTSDNNISDGIENAGMGGKASPVFVPEGFHKGSGAADSGRKQTTTSSVSNVDRSVFQPPVLADESVAIAAKSPSSSEEASDQDPPPVSAESRGRTINKDLTQAQEDSLATQGVASSAGSNGVRHSTTVTDDAASQLNPHGTAVPVASEPTFASAGSGSISTQPSPQSSVRPGHAPGVTRTFQHTSHPIEGQSTASSATGTSVDLSRDPTKAGGDLAAGGTLAGQTSGAAVQPAMRETFATLDSEAGPGRSTWVHASVQHAEAGFQDPTLGWVSVRADVNAGGIHAAVVPGSADAAQALGGQLAGLNSYLTEHHTPVQSVTLAAPESHEAGSVMDQSANQTMHQGAGQNTQQEPGQGGQSDTRARASALSASASSDVRTLSAVQGATVETARAGSVHISVMA